MPNLCCKHCEKDHYVSGTGLTFYSTICTCHCHRNESSATTELNVWHYISLLFNQREKLNENSF